MSKFCPDTECDFWEDFPDGLGGKKAKACPYCSQALVTEKSSRDTPNILEQEDSKSGSGDSARGQDMKQSVPPLPGVVSDFESLDSEPNSEKIKNKKVTLQPDEQLVNRSFTIYTEIDTNETSSVLIRFTTLILKEYWKKIDAICLRIGLSYFGEFNTSIVPFSKLNTVKLQCGKFVTIRGTLKFPSKLISQGKICFPYKYFIYSKDNNQGFEQLHHSVNNFNRYFILDLIKNPEQQLNNAIFQQFDMMILPEIRKKEDTAFWSFVNTLNLMGSSGKNEKDIPFYNIADRRLVSLQILLPSYLGLGHSHSCSNLEDFISHFQKLVDILMNFSIQLVHGQTIRLWEITDYVRSDDLLKLVTTWIMDACAPERVTHIELKSIVCKFYLGCYLVYFYKIKNDDLMLKLINLIEESIEPILKKKYFLFDDTICLHKPFELEIQNSLSNFLFNQLILSKHRDKFLTLIPLYHGITNMQKHSILLHEALEYTDKNYWGFPNEVAVYQQNTVPIDCIQRALSLAKHDQIIPYTVVIYSLNENNVNMFYEYFIKDTQHYPLSALMAAVLFRLHHTQPDYVWRDDKLRIEMMNVLNNAFTKDSTKLDVHDVIRLTKLTLILTLKLPAPNVFQEDFRLCLSLLSQGIVYCDEKLPDDLLITSQKMTEFFNNFVKRWYCNHIVKQHMHYSDYLAELKFWEEIVTNYLFPQKIKWLEIIESFLVPRFRDTLIRQQFIIDLFIHLHTKEGYSPLLQEIFLKELTSRLHTIKSGDKNNFVKQLFQELSQSEQLIKVNNILSEILLNEEQNVNLNPIFHFVTWTFWEAYFSFLSDKNIDQFLSAKARDMLELATTQFFSVFEQINDFKITGLDLELIDKNRSYFITLTGILVKRDCEYSIEDISIKLDSCMRMHKWILEQINLLSSLNSFMDNIQNIYSEVLSVFLSLRLEKERIGDICYPDRDTYLFINFPLINTIITFPQFISMCTACTALSKSRIIIQFFDTIVREKGIKFETPFDIKFFYEEIWKPALETSIRLIDTFSNETILISEMCKYFDGSESLETILNDLVALSYGCTQVKSEDKHFHKTCAKKIHLYSDLQQCSDAASLIIKLKSELLLVNNFDIIENMKNIKQNFENKQLKELTDKVINLALELRNLSKSNLDVIQAIIDRIDFIMWIRSNLKDLNELKTFVDISQTTCGGNPVDVDRITCLSSVCTNFAPIIFQIDENTSYETLIAKCRQVMESVERNKELTKLLRQVGENVTFWEEMKQSHGSVEETTLMQLASIMKSGQFDVKLGDSLNLCDIVSLSVERENGEKRLYSLEQLREFRSKLMLVVSKTELPGLDTYTGSYENSQLFTHKLDTLTEIATIVIQLAETGNQRYLKYELHSDCNQQEDTLMETKDKLRNTLEDWRANVEEARNRHYFLNYYTISQIVFLQKGIKSFIEEREDRDLEQLYHLLGLLNPDVSKQDIQQALEHFITIPERNPSSDNIQTEFINNFSSMEKCLAQEVSEEADLPLELVYLGINKLTQDNGDVILKSKLLIWCLEHEEINATESINKTPVRDSSVKSLSNSFHYSSHTVIDLFQLGSFLEDLYQSSDVKIRSRRELPYNLKSGSPNLVVIPSAGMLEFVLSLYMSDNDKLPLPYYHEILICTPQTRLEEIEIFWRRAVMIPDRLNLFLFCLIGIENLSYDVAVQAVAKLKRFQQNPEQIGSYKLILICSEEKEESSYMAAALDDCKVPILFRIKSQNMIAYVIGRLSPVYPRTIYKSRDPAWMVDRKNSRVRLVVSDSVGAGKSLYINNLKSDLLSQGIVSEEEMEQSAVTVAIHGKQASEEHLAAQLLKRRVSGVKHGVMYHVDIASTVQLCLEPILFKLLILGGICKRSGELWHSRGRDYYVIEMILNSAQNDFYCLFPSLCCSQPSILINASPTSSQDASYIEQIQIDQLYRLISLLKQWDNLYDILYNMSSRIGGYSYKDRLVTIMNCCGTLHPTWTEVSNFITFLDKQLSDCDNSDYCLPDSMGEEWRGFKQFAVWFLMIMSRDFATPFLEEDPDLDADNIYNKSQLLPKRNWEFNSYPYLFPNQDGHTMTFLGFHISNTGHLIDPENPSNIIKHNMIRPKLYKQLIENGVNLLENVNQLTRMQKITKLSKVMGIECSSDPDPDPGYVLTLDNMRKILAILMRFRCNIPVVIMGETGCGKTRLIQFMCSLQALQTGACNMLILKVHGGTTETDVMSKVEEAGKLAERNYAAHQIDTVLFFDEANTSPAIGLIKEIMCDRRMYGRHIRTDIGLQFIAACNPYRRHTEEMLKKLSSAGLGFFTKASETTDRLGDIPLRELVYRVMELPASLRPLVWDFGQLSNSIEKTYTREIVARHLRERNSPIEARDEIVDAISDVLAGAQNYMRERKDECSFVSLRDVERAMRVMLWFYSKLEYFRPEEDTSDGVTIVERDINITHRAIERLNGIDPITYSLIISLFVCYRARLQERDEFDEYLVNIIRDPLTPIVHCQVLHREVERCQGLLLDQMTIGANIAKNTALKENVFMMFVCIELKIPLFVIGKPGSSKSLAKSIISNSMQGSRCPDGSILQNFKQVQIMSYQCSQLSTADGIIGVFNSCMKLQRKTGSNKFTACVVLDEVGLAEDSPLLPLKVLHPLLEDSSYGSEDVELVEEDTELIHKVVESPTDIPIQFEDSQSQVAFIGLSNWSLDPAKMNRGVMLSRGDFEEAELITCVNVILQITSNQGAIIQSIEQIIQPLANAYLGLISKIVQKDCLRRDYYGLRDLYSLVKMLGIYCCEYDTTLNRSILVHAVKRNFGRVSEVNPVEIFLKYIKLPDDNKIGPDSSPLGLISANLKNLSLSYHGETRYLLLLTENYAALNILLRSPDMWPKQQDIQSICVIFGSSFPCDQEYSAVCRNINRIKVCMESGKTVILLNLENICESLYNVLNMTNQRYVDLGLGTHRMKCRVHNDFKLIVVADKQTVQERFPTPLINRLEKHILTMSTVLTEDELIISKQLADWADKFSTLDKTHFLWIRKKGDFTVGDCFIGYHNDTPSSIVFHVMKEMYPEGMPTESRIDTTAVLERSQTQLLRMATTDAVLRVKNSLLSLQSEQIIAEYFKLQLGSLEEYLSQVLSGICGSETGTHLTLATTHSRLLTERDIDQLQQRLSTDTDSLQIRSLSLQQFQTEQQYIREVQKFLRGEDSERERRETTHRKILLVQCERGAENGKLIACARHKTVDELKDWREEQRGELKCEVFLLFLVQLNREAHGSKFMSFCGGDWNTVHIDDVRYLDYTEMPPISQLIGTQVYQLFDGHAMVSVGFHCSSNDSILCSL